MAGCIGLDVRPYLKRVIVDYCLNGIAQAAKLRATVEWNHARNCRHVRLYGDRIILTANAVDGLNQSPRMAQFRQKLSQSLNLSLFPEGDDVTEALFLPSTCLAHIVHGGHGQKPDFVGIQVPSADGQSYLHVEAMDVVAQAPDTPVEEIDEDVIERLLRDKKGKEGNGTI